MLKILFTGGGSGGHIFPLVAVSEELACCEHNSGSKLSLHYLGASGKFSVVLENNGILVHSVAGGKFRNYFSILNYLDFLKIFFSFIQSFFKMYFLMPDVLFSKGGTSALPVVIAARFYRVPVIIHDSDAIPGRTNRISGIFASRIAISFKNAYKFFAKEKTAFTGNPIRAEFFKPAEDKNVLLQELGFKKDIPLILVLGSSQGAARVNDFIFSVAPMLLEKFQVLHQVGMKNIQSAEIEQGSIIQGLADDKKELYKVSPFLEDDYATAIKAADLVISRASSGAIFEIAAAGKPSILIPLPLSAQDHQRENAYEYASTGATLIIDEENLLPNILFEQIVKILDAPETQEAMSRAARSFARPDAAKIIAEEILRLALRN